MGVWILKYMFEGYIGEDLDICCRRMLLMSCFVTASSLSTSKMIQKSCEISWTSSLPPTIFYFVSKPEIFWNLLKALCESVVWVESSDNLQVLLVELQENHSRNVCPFLFYLVFKLREQLQTSLELWTCPFQVKATCAHPTNRTAKSITPRMSTRTGAWT